MGIDSIGILYGVYSLITWRIWTISTWNLAKITAPKKKSF